MGKKSNRSGETKVQSKYQNIIMLTITVQGPEGISRVDGRDEQLKIKWFKRTTSLPKNTGFWGAHSAARDITSKESPQGLSPY